MQKTTPLLPGLHVQTLRRRPRSSQQKLAEKVAQFRRRTFDQTGPVFRELIPSSLLGKAPSGQSSRHRIFNKENTFWAFMGQVFSEDSSCQEVVRKLQAYAALRGAPIPSSSTASYCAARKRLQVEDLSSIFAATSEHMNTLPEFAGPFGRRVIVVDGTGASMPDTAENQKHWPQESQQKPGCGFPLVKLLGCFSLQTGALLSWRMGNQHQHELTLFRQQWGCFEEGDIMLVDKGFCSYYDIAKLSGRSVDTVVTLARRKPIQAVDAVEKLSENDLIVRWKRPRHNRRFTREQWNELPEELLLRQIRVDVQCPGFRTQQLHIITTLLDPKQYPAGALADLYFRRWDVELFFKDIKITLGMDVLRCKSPDMIQKEITIFLIAYNCLRRLMYEASEAANLPVRRISFKGAVQALRNWEPHLNQLVESRKEQRRLIGQLHNAVAGRAVPFRPDRTEPRARKRRPKNYQLLSKPRHEITVSNHRNIHRAQACTNPLN